MNRVPRGVRQGGQFTQSTRGEAGVGLAVTPPTPVGFDAEWFSRLAPHQQHTLSEQETVTVLDASGDPIDVVPGIIDDEADWVYKRGQCLALAVALAEKTGGKVYCQRVDFDDVDADGNPFHNLGHAYVELPEGVLLDIQGEHGEPSDLTDEFGIELEDTAIEPLIFDNPRDALAHFDGYVVEQDTVAAEPFAATVLAHYRFGTYIDEIDYDGLTPDDAKALLNVDIQRRYMLGDCGVLAHYLAEENGWGVCIVGEYEHDEEDDYFSVEQLQHAYAVRPDGTLVDVTGAHSPTAADDGSRASKMPRHDYPDAASADRIWDHSQWYGSDGWDDDLDAEDEVALARHVARLVAIAYEEDS